MERCHNCGEHKQLEIGICCTLYEKIDLDRVQCLNESVEGSGVTVFKPWEERLDRTKFVKSDIDPELIFNIPFTANVKLKSIIVIADQDLHPTSVKLFRNRPNLAFDCLSCPDQELPLHGNQHGVYEYPVMTVKFSSVYHLSLHFTGNTDEIKIYYIGLRGEWTKPHRHGVTICAYEARPLISDHTVDLNSVSNTQIK